MKQATHPEYHEVKVVCTCGISSAPAAPSRRRQQALTSALSATPSTPASRRSSYTGGRVACFQRRYGNKGGDQKKK